MTENGYLIWIVAMAIMTIFVLTVGTLAAAHMISREKREDDEKDRPQPDVLGARAEPATTDPEQRRLPAA